MQKSKVMTAIARVFSKSQSTHSLVGEVYKHAIGKPLLVHAEFGANSIRGYLDAPVANDNGDVEDDVIKHENIGVIDISGPMVNRPIRGFCSSGPASYQDIKEDFDELMVDDNIKTIVLRCDSPGGSASGVMDLSDHIFHSRGQKKIIAIVDDMAYSAMYAIASACDEIYVSRTSGVGSIGVVTYHIDQSEFDKKIGVKVEFIYAGDKKVAGNPHEPLSDQARTDMQTEIDRLYDIFVSTVARNRNMDEQKVRETQAGCFYGDTSISVGLADKLGTFSEVIGNLVSVSENVDDSAGMSSQALDDSEGMSAIQDNAQVEGVGESEGELEAGSGDESEEEVDIAATENNLPQVDASVVGNNTLNAESESTHAEKAAQTEKVSKDTKVKSDAEIRAICAAAGIPDASAEYIKAGTSVDQVRKDLFEATTAGETEILTAAPVALHPQASQPKTPNANNIYAKRRKGR
ncbi:S49 family peptidase [Hydrogenovibrio sp. 3SP14C1]|uniref:S49 family peptidase n=1 Tax=Hydrogenovibrio sp. 3SP14C1 TaxID=3038774 RepID=UPI002416B7CF|nr:S49 family peptidase [Hydrogenovibrio sp. 3SP14C1]MDG4811925.1 S49 family peptidase [Hydrogenovibrio sp. 3SP14C1]